MEISRSQNKKYRFFDDFSLIVSLSAKLKKRAMLGAEGNIMYFKRKSILKKKTLQVEIASFEIVCWVLPQCCWMSQLNCLQRQTAVTAYFFNDQILLFVFIYGITSSANSRGWSDAGLMLFHRLRRRPSINPALAQLFVFAGSPETRSTRDTPLSLILPQSDP